MPRQAKPIPSELFLGAILRGYRTATTRKPGVPVTPSAVWDEICIECLRTSNGFKTMFEWDTRAGNRNRIGTIREVIEAGLVPGMRIRDGGKVIETLSTLSHRVAASN